MKKVIFFLIITLILMRVHVFAQASSLPDPRTIIDTVVTSNYGPRDVSVNESANIHFGIDYRRGEGFPEPALETATFLPMKIQNDTSDWIYTNLQSKNLNYPSGNPVDYRYLHIFKNYDDDQDILADPITIMVPAPASSASSNEKSFDSFSKAFILTEDQSPNHHAVIVNVAYFQNGICYANYILGPVAGNTVALPGPNNTTVTVIDAFSLGPQNPIGLAAKTVKDIDMTNTPQISPAGHSTDGVMVVG